MSLHLSSCPFSTRRITREWRSDDGKESVFQKSSSSKLRSWKLKINNFPFTTSPISSFFFNDISITIERDKNRYFQFYDFSRFSKSPKLNEVEMAEFAEFFLLKSTNPVWVFDSKSHSSSPFLTLPLTSLFLTLESLDFSVLHQRKSCGKVTHFFRNSIFNFL